MKTKSRILVGIPVVLCADHFLPALESVVNEADVLVIDNGAAEDVKGVISSFGDRIAVIRNEQNIYVNPAWQQIIDHFLAGTWDKLIIMNSDLAMRQHWSDLIWGDVIPVLSDGDAVPVTVTEGTAGVFIVLTREQVEIINPLPDYCAVWFGDEWIYTILRNLGYLTVKIPGLRGRHINGGSQNVQKIAGVYEIIDLDKESWATFGALDVQTRVNQNQHRRFPKSSLVEPE